MMPQTLGDPVWFLFEFVLRVKSKYLANARLSFVVQFSCSLLSLTYKPKSYFTALAHNS